ncbi:MAG: T9SS type A sorting domain-containing protein [Moheibacter sp.]
MKHFFTKLLLVGLFPLAAYGQTIVSTTPENKKAILEEFTGIYCVYCPEGHAIAEQILTQNPGNAFAINIHQGGYAAPSGGDPDFRTPWGNAIAGQTGLAGYPAATVNRHVFPGRSQGASGTTAMNRNYWKTSALEIIATPSYLNMAVEASIDIETRLLTVHVEAYYTGSSPESTNLLNVALLQNNTKGPQTGGGSGNNYNHMRRLVDLITGQWGETITTTSAGSFVDKTYTYTIPADYNGISAILPDMEIVVFMTETHQEIISGNGTFPALLGLEYEHDAGILSISNVDRTCTNVIAPTVTIQNNGEDTITEMDVEYKINGETHVYNWTGSLSSLHTVTIDLPEVTFNLQANNDLDIKILNSDQNPSNNNMSMDFLSAPDSQTNNLVLTINTDGKGAQTRWIIKNSSNQTIKQGNGYGNNQTYEIDIELPGNDCYSLRVLDTGNDGGASISLADGNGNVLIESDGNYGGGFTKAFSKGALGVNDQQIVEVNVYPNPTTGIVNLVSGKNIDNVNVYDVSGRLVKTVNKISSDKSVLDLSSLANGTYILKIQTDKKVVTKKVIIK